VWKIFPKAHEATTIFLLHANDLEKSCKKNENFRSTATDSNPLSTADISNFSETAKAN